MRRAVGALIPLATPEACHGTLEECVSNQTQLNSPASLRAVWPGRTLQRSLPLTLDDSLRNRFARMCSAEVRAANVFSIADGRYWGLGAGTLLMPDNRVVYEFSRVALDYGPELHPALMRYRLPPLRRIEGDMVAFCDYALVDNYYHWLTDLLPRALILREAGIELSACAGIVLTRWDLPFQREILDLLGVSPGRVLPGGPGSYYQAKKLAIASYTNPDRCADRFVVPPQGIEFVRQLVPEVAPPLAANKIYVSRRRAARRLVTNEDEVAEVMRQRGIAVVCLEGLTVAQQAALFRNADLVVAPHGAGLTNLLFAKPGTRVLEFFNATYVPGDYWSLSSQLNLKYAGFTCAATPLQRRLELLRVPDRFRARRNITVDIARLNQHLDLLGS